MQNLSLPKRGSPGPLVPPPPPPPPLYAHGSIILPTFSGAPYCNSIEHVVTHEVHTLSCVSYGSPPTEVIWERDGERIYFNDTSSDIYHPNQVLLNRTTSAYNNTLTINATIEDVTGEYSCTIVNTVGRSDRLNTTIKGDHYANCLPPIEK